VWNRCAIGKFLVHDSFFCVLGGVSSISKKHLGPWGTKRENGNDIATMGATMKQRRGEMVGIMTKQQENKRV
jgi:hypothetical protein